MTRQFDAMTSATSRVALSLVALGLAACSFSYRSEGSSSPARSGKPAIVNDDDDARPSKPTRKPIAKADPSEPTRPAEPAPAEPTESAGPTRTRPTEPPPTVEPRATAVCRVQDATLEPLCHLALDPIAADDVDAWAAHLDEAVVVTRPGERKGMQRLDGPEAVRSMASRAGGLRAMLNLRPTDRVVGTLVDDCRDCRRAVVTFEANTRSGTITVELEATEPPVIASVNVASTVRRTKPVPERPATIQPPPKDGPAPGVIIQPKDEPSPNDKPTLKDEPGDQPTIKGKPEPKPTIKAKPKPPGQPTIKAKPQPPGQPTIKKPPAEIIVPEKPGA